MNPAAVVLHRGVTVRIYGPLRDRKREVYLLANYAGSRRTKQTFKGTLEAAKRKAKEICNGVTAGEIIDALHLTPLDRRVYITAKEAAATLGRAVDVVCREAAEAAKIVGAGVSPMEQARFWRLHHSSDLPSATVSQVVAELLSFLENNKRRAGVTVETLRSLLKKFSTAFHGPIAHVQTAEIEQWLGSLHVRPRTLNNYRAAILRLFNFSRGRYLPKDGPTAATGIERVTDERGPVQIFKPWELAAILANADDSLLPAIALGAFAGLRNVELSRLEYSAIRLTEVSKEYPHGLLEVPKAAAKKHRGAARRIVGIQPNLARWLEPYAFRNGPISPYQSQSSLSRALTALIASINGREAKQRRRVIRRPANGLRHSYGSYRLPVLKSAAALAIEMNNSEAEIWRDYHELAAPAEVQAWWNIYPADDVLGLFKEARPGSVPK